MKEVVLKKTREKSLALHHPWVFSGAVEKVGGRPGPGETVEVYSSDGRWLARGAYSPESQIRVRVWTFDPDEEVDPAFFRSRLLGALDARRVVTAGRDTDAFRVVNSESDGLPGIIADRYGDWLVCQFLTAGAERWRQEAVSQLLDLMPAQGVFERSDADIRAKEGLPPRTGVMAGGDPPGLVEIRENGMRFLVDVRGGHKTGFYLDQRDNRACLAGYARSREVLNCFSYTGGFGVSALTGGAPHVVNIDSSRTALEIAARNVELGGFEPSLAEQVEGDVFAVLRRYRDAGRTFDAVVLDPPKFVESRGQLMRASRGYKDINLLAFRVLKPGGILFTFSCSGLLERDLFQKIVFDAALDAGRDARILQWLSQAPDHPVALSFPEGAYLKGLVCMAS